MKLIAPILALVLVAAACGGSDDDTAADDTTTSVAETAETSEEETTTTSEAAEPDTTAAAAGSDADGAGSDYCNASAEADALIDEWQIGSPESTEQYFTAVLDLIESIDPPSEVAEDFATLRQGFIDLSSELEQVDWNILAIADDNPVVNNPATEAASDRIDAFDLSYCGPSDDSASPGLDGDDLASLLDNPEVNDLLAEAGIELTEEQTSCLAQNLDADLLSSVTALLGGDQAGVDPEAISSLLELLVTCEIPLTAFANAL